MKNRKYNVLKISRVIVALLIFAPILLFFVDFRDILPDKVHSLLHFQVVPAILSGAVGIMIFLFLLTLFFGRVYCSVICPAGVLQDIFNRIACIGKKKRKGILRFRYHKPLNILRYAILGVSAALAVFGFMELCLLLDPYSNFGRIATNLFRPVAIWINNLLAEALTRFGIYTLYNVSFRISTGALVASVVAFLVFFVMAWWRGRLFCNTLCPVGALLSLVSRFSFFRLKVDENACNKCGVCGKSCKAEAIDSVNGTVDMSRCVGCFNCISHCKQDALRFGVGDCFGLRSRNDGVPKVLDCFVPRNDGVGGGDRVNGRRSFIATGAAIAAGMPLLALAKGKDSAEKPLPVTPPGSLSIERFKDLCTGCHLCVVQCPSRVLLPAGLQFGFGYMLKPYMSYIDSYCNFSCTVCSDVCPTRAITQITEEEKKVTQVGIANFYINRCIVKTEETDCGACSEHCPTQAVHMVPYKGTLTIPQVEAELCVGCGGCESICPVRPERAIVIISNPVHKKAEKPKEEEIKKVDVNDFGF